MHVSVADTPDDLVAIAADVPDAVSRRDVRVDALPAGWRSYPAPEALADLGTRWVGEGETALLVVPSAVIPRESNYLLNPRHPDFRSVRIGRPERFTFDRRLWAR